MGNCASESLARGILGPSSTNLEVKEVGRRFRATYVEVLRNRSDVCSGFLTDSEVLNFEETLDIEAQEGAFLGNFFWIGKLVLSFFFFNINLLIFIIIIFFHHISFVHVALRIWRALVPLSSGHKQRWQEACSIFERDFAVRGRRPQSIPAPPDLDARPPPQGWSRNKSQHSFPQRYGSNDQSERE